jgi:hypothetical protein
MSIRMRNDADNGYDLPIVLSMNENFFASITDDERQVPLKRPREEATDEFVVPTSLATGWS